MENFNNNVPMEKGKNINHISQVKIFTRFIYSEASPHPYLNYCQSSLQSLSNYRLCFFSCFKLFFYPSLKSLQSLHKDQCNSKRVSLNLLETLAALKITLIQILSLKLQAAAKQGPAVTVIPVLRPRKPSLLNSLLVFSHSTSRVISPFLTVVLKYLQDVTFLNNSIFMQTQQSLARSIAVDLASWEGSPWGLPNLVFFSYKTLAYRFIYPTKALRRFFGSLLLLEKAPAQQASSLAASFPLGSISPYNNSSTVYCYPSTSSAEVPPISLTSGVTVITSFLISTPLSSAIAQMTQKVMILVRLAIYSDSPGLLLTITLSEGYSTSIQLSDLTALSSSGFLIRTGYFFYSFSSGSFTFELAPGIILLFLLVSRVILYLNLDSVLLLLFPEKIVRFWVISYDLISCCSQEDSGLKCRVKFWMGLEDKHFSQDCSLLKLSLLIFLTKVMPSSEMYLLIWCLQTLIFLEGDSQVTSVFLMAEIIISCSSSSFGLNYGLSSPCLRELGLGILEKIFQKLRS